MRRRLKLLPTPISGLALAIASLGWSWDNLLPAQHLGQLLGAIIGGLLLMLISIKFILAPRMLFEELQHPVVGSVMPTYAMGLMVISNMLGYYSRPLGDGLWCFALLLHLLFLIAFAYHRMHAFSLTHMVPSWFVPPIGLIVADVSFSGTAALSPIATAALIFGCTAYAFLLPLMMYRLVFAGEVPDAAKPTIAIMAAPASLSLAGYLSLTPTPSFLIVSVLLGIALLMTAFIYVSFVRLFRLPFSPGFAAFTFPMVIGATALFKTADWMAQYELTRASALQVEWLAIIELIIATVVVLFVSFHYKRFISLQWRTK